MKLKSILLLPALMVLLVACGGSTAAPLPPYTPYPTYTPVPPTGTPTPPATHVPPTLTPSATPSTTPTPTKATPSATPTTAMSTDTTTPLELAALCSFDQSVSKISCRASGTTKGSHLRWKSSVSGWSTGPSYEFQLVEAHQLVPQVVVTLEECKGEPSCQSVEVLLDTSSIVPASEQAAGSAKPELAGEDSAVSGGQNVGHPGLVGCVEKDSTEFTHHVTDLESVNGIYPNIVTSGNWLKPNNYIWIDQDAPVYAPANATSVGLNRWIQNYLSESGSPQERLQFTIELQISCAIRVSFGHLEQLAKPFTSLAPTEAAINSVTLETFVYLPIEVKAGTLLGYARYRSLSGAADGFDFVMYNSEKSNHFVNKERYQTQGDLETILHTDCPFDYYSQSMRAEWVAKFGVSGQTIAGYDCDMAPDVVGTIAGGWFQSPHDPAIRGKSLVDWGLAIRIKSDGWLNIGHPGGTLTIDSTDPTFRDPKTVFSARCFYDSSHNQFGYLKPIGDMEMAAAFGSGTCPYEMPSNSQTFYR